MFPKWVPGRAESTDTNAVCSSKNGKDREHGAQRGAARATQLVQWNMSKPSSVVVEETTTSVLNL